MIEYENKVIGDTVKHILKLAKTLDIDKEGRISFKELRDEIEDCYIFEGNIKQEAMRKEKYKQLLKYIELNEEKQKL